MSRLLLALLCAVALLAGCDSSGQTSGQENGPATGQASATSHAAASPPMPLPAPKVDDCHRIGPDAAAKPTGSGVSVPCRQAHTTITYFVGSVDPVEDGHLLAVDSRRVQADLARICPRRLPAYLGADEETVRLSRLEALWFAPAAAQVADGAHWFRCDLAAVGAGGRLLRLPASMRAALASPEGLDTWGTCGTSSPSKAGFQTVICGRKHAWRAIRTVEIAGGGYLARPATAAGDVTCKDAASVRTADALRYAWSFQWPSRALWRSGDHHGLCWVPDPSGS